MTAASSGQKFFRSSTQFMMFCTSEFELSDLASQAQCWKLYASSCWSRPRPRGAVGRVPTLSPEKPNQESSNSGRSKSKQGINQIMENQSSKPGQITDEEAQSLNKQKLCSVYKLKEINGINIFFAGSENDASESETNGNLSNRTSVRIVQQAAN
nr:Alpha-ketoglutarate-dependent dioxygenase alkB -like protein 2 [Ipomoea batatas]